MWIFVFSLGVNFNNTWYLSCEWWYQLQRYCYVFSDKFSITRVKVGIVSALELSSYRMLPTTLFYPWTKCRRGMGMPSVYQPAHAKTFINKHFWNHVFTFILWIIKMTPFCATWFQVMPSGGLGLAKKGNWWFPAFAWEKCCGISFWDQPYRGSIQKWFNFGPRGPNLVHPMAPKRHKMTENVSGHNLIIACSTAIKLCVQLGAETL